MTRFDVIIVGGGVAGLATALALRSAGHSVAVIERGGYDRAQIGETFPPEIKLPLAQLDLWHGFRALRCPQMPSRLSAWGSERLDEVDYIFNAYGNGWLVARPAFEKMMAGRAVDCGVRLIHNAYLRACGREGDRSWRFALADDAGTHVLRGRFAVAATGRASSVLRGPGETRAVHDQLLAIVTRAARPVNWSPDDHRPLIEATADGWWFSALFPDGLVHLAMMTDLDLARARMRQYHSRLRMLNALLGRAPSTRERLGRRPELIAPVHVVSANTYMNDKLIGDAKLAVGDSASAFDPLAGQGSFAALSGGIRAAKAIAEYFRIGGDALQRYADQERLRFAQFLADRTAYYRMEPRWPHSRFWMRRHVAP